MPRPLLYFNILANKFTWSRLLIQIQILNGKQCRYRSQLIWSYTVCKSRTYPGSAGLRLMTWNVNTKQHFIRNKMNISHKIIARSNEKELLQKYCHGTVWSQIAHLNSLTRAVCDWLIHHNLLTLLIFCNQKTCPIDFCIICSHFYFGQKENIQNFENQWRTKLFCKWEF